MSAVAEKLHPGLAALAFAEIVIGLFVAGAGVYFLLDLSNCKPNAEFCRPLGILVVLVLLAPGVVVATSGAFSYVSKRFPFWTTQFTMVGVLVLYYLCLFGLMWVFGQPGQVE